MNYNTDAYEHILESPNLDTYECVVIAKEAIAEVKRLREGIEDALGYLMIEVGGAEQAAIDTLKELIE
tara:strand:+ start:369 stop:572 length:204 start_codon:yes stop_codon:yes gene_type:complete